LCKESADKNEKIPSFERIIKILARDVSRRDKSTDASSIMTD
jgi:hypothetical protein